MIRRSSFALIPAVLVLIAGVSPDFAWSSQPAAIQEVPGGSPIASTPTDISALLEPLIAKHAIPGLAAVVVRGDGTILFQGATGVRQSGDDAKLTIDDQFHLGSCTKAMTATLAAIMVEEGTLSWDRTLGEAFPELFSPPTDDGITEKSGTKKPSANPVWKGVTLRSLLTNRSGAPANLDKDGLWGKLWRFKGESRAARRLLLEGVLSTEPLSAPGEKFIYSNAGFAIAGHMTEIQADTPWESLIQQKLFAPLGITTAGYGAPGAVRDVQDGDGGTDRRATNAIDQPRGHRTNGTPVQPGPGSDNPAAIGPAGTVHMSLADWSKFIALHLRGARRELRAVGSSAHPDPLQAESIKVLHSPAGSTKPNDGYAFGWNVTTRPWASANRGGDTRVLTHSGSNTMWFCVAWLSPDRNFAVLVACNQGGDKAAKAADAAAFALIGEFNKVEKQLDPTPSSERALGPNPKSDPTSQPKPKPDAD